MIETLLLSSAVFYVSIVFKREEDCVKRGKKSKKKEMLPYFFNLSHENRIFWEVILENTPLCGS
jgi:hypothetical protein